ncbi:hypothetical protein Bbelb_023260 [Branchiostoma belcheri]|nr:hypothetical protein Bbelb_023260 [Branchiostoma belcheri]
MAINGYRPPPPLHMPSFGGFQAVTARKMCYQTAYCACSHHIKALAAQELGGFAHAHVDTPIPEPGGWPEDAPLPPPEPTGAFMSTRRENFTRPRDEAGGGGGWDGRGPVEKTFEASRQGFS